MKAAALLLLVAVCCVECRKIYPQINKNANVDFINMESGGMPSRPAAVQPPKPGAAAPAATSKAPAPAPAKPAAQPAHAPAGKPAAAPAAAPATVAPPTAAQPQKPAQPTQTPPQPSHAAVQPKPVPVKPSAGASPTTTPGPGSVKSLINFYDSKGNASPIRPYSYSQAVKQG